LYYFCTSFLQNYQFEIYTIACQALRRAKRRRKKEDVRPMRRKKKSLRGTYEKGERNAG
jgi:phage protein U